MEKRIQTRRLVLPPGPSGSGKRKESGKDNEPPQSELWFNLAKVWIGMLLVWLAVSMSR